VRDLTLVSLRKQIGKVTQETVLFNDTVRNNIAYGQPDVPMEQGAGGGAQWRWRMTSSCACRRATTP
jgi:ABC-type phosphate transport system ATPase subunit